MGLRQGSISVAEFSIQFRTLAIESGWNREALTATFLHALSEKVKDELSSRDVPDTLERLISLAIQIDNRIRERNRERKHAHTRSATGAEFTDVPRASESLTSLPGVTSPCNWGAHDSLGQRESGR